MKICILGNTGKSIDKAYSGFVRTITQGMRLNGCEIIGFDYKSHRPDQIYEFLMENCFDVIFTHLTFHKHHDSEEMVGMFDMVRSLCGSTIIHTMQDAREEPRYKDDISVGFDMALVSQTKNIPKFEKYGKVPVYYWPYSSMTYKEMGKYNSNLNFGVPVFPGGERSHEDRYRFIKMLKHDMSIKIIGTKSRDDMREKTQNFSVSSPCVLGLSTRYDGNIGGYIDVRPGQYGGAGAILITRPHSEQHKVIPPDLYYTIPNYNRKSVEKIREHGKTISRLSDNQKYGIRKKIFNFMQQKHSSYIRMKQTLEIIEGKRDRLDVGV